EDAVEPLAVDPGEVRGQRMVGAGRLGPGAAFLVEGAQELGGICRRPLRVEHRLDRREGMAVPAVVDLDAADIEGGPVRGNALAGEGEGLLAGVEPETLAFAVDRPRPGAEPPARIAAGLGERDGVEDLDRHTASPRALDDRL